MLDTIIGRQIRRSTRNLLIWNALMLAGIIAFFVISHRYWHNFAAGPFRLSTEEVLELKNDDGPKTYVSVRGDRCVDTGVTRAKKDGSDPSERYLELMYGDKLLIVKAWPKDSISDVERRGVLQPVPPDVSTNVRMSLDRDIQQAKAQNPGMKVTQFTYLPVMLDTTITRTKGFIGLAILIPLGLLNGFNIFRAFARFNHPHNHPIAKSLMRYGDPEEVATKIDDEFNSDDKQLIGPATITRSWMIHPTTFKVDVVFLGDSAWAYKTITQHSVNGVPTGKTYAANLCDIHGNQFTVPLKTEALTDEFVLGVLQRVPWVLVGFAPELEQLWKKDKAALYEIVEQRRKQLADHLRSEREGAEAAEQRDIEPA